MAQAYLLLVGLGALVIEVAALRALDLDVGCSVGAALSVSLQATYTFACTHDLSLQAVVGLVPAPHRAAATLTRRPLKNVTPGPSLQSDGGQVGTLDTYVWNATVFSTRVVGMVGAVIAAMVVTATRKYNMPFLEPFLVISSAQVQRRRRTRRRRNKMHTTIMKKERMW